MKPKSSTSRLPGPSESNARKSLIARRSGLPRASTFGSKISKPKLKERKVISGVVQNVFQNKGPNSTRIGRKSVRFQDPSSSEKNSAVPQRKTLQSIENKQQVNLNEMNEDNFSSQFGEDFEFKSDPDALASILNDEGVSSDLLRKSQIAEAVKQGKSADEFLLADGRPSLCRRVPTNRTSDVRSSILSSRVSLVPGRVARSSTTGRSSFMNPRSSTIRQSAVRNSLFSFIEKRYSLKHQDDVIKPSAAPVRSSIRSSVKPNPPKKVDFEDKLSPAANKKTENEIRMSSARRILASKLPPNQQNIAASPALRLPSSPNPFANSPASRLKRSVKKTPGKSRLADDHKHSPKPKDNIVTTLSFSDDENQSPSTIQQPTVPTSKPANARKSISRLKPVSQVNKHQNLQKQGGNQTRKTDIPTTNSKSRLSMRNSSRFSSGKLQPPRLKIKKEIETHYVQPDLKNEEELVQPRVLNEDDLPQKEPNRAPFIPKMQPQHHDNKMDILEPKALNEITPNKKAQPEFKKPGKVSSKIPSFGFKAKKTMVDADDVLNLINKKLATVKRRSVQAELSSFMKSLEMSLSSVKEDNEVITEVKPPSSIHEDPKPVETETFSKKLVLAPRSTDRSLLDQSKDTKTGLRPWKEVLASESSPTWRDIFKKSKEQPENISVKVKEEVETPAPIQTTSTTQPAQDPAQLAHLRRSYEESLEQIAQTAAETKNLEEKMKQLEMRKQNLQRKGNSILNEPARTKLHDPLIHPDITPAKERIMKVLDIHAPVPVSKPGGTMNKYFGPIISPPNGSMERSISSTTSIPSQCERKVDSIQRHLVSVPSVENFEENDNFVTQNVAGQIARAKSILNPLQNQRQSEESVQQLTKPISRLSQPTKVPHFSKKPSTQISRDINPTCGSKNVEWIDVKTSFKDSKIESKNPIPTMTQMESPNTIKPDTAKTMSWEESSVIKPGKITSGRIGQRSQILGDKSGIVRTSDDKCPILPVVYPESMLRNFRKNSPIVKEKLTPPSKVGENNPNMGDVFSKSPEWDPSFINVKPAERKDTVRSSCSSVGGLGDTMLQNATLMSPNFCARVGMTYEEMHKWAENSLLDNTLAPTTAKVQKSCANSQTHALSYSYNSKSSPLLISDKDSSRGTESLTRTSTSPSHRLLGPKSDIDNLSALDSLSIVGLELSKDLHTAGVNDENSNKISQSPSSLKKLQNTKPSPVISQTHSKLIEPSIGTADSFITTNLGVSNRDKVSYLESDLQTTNAISSHRKKNVDIKDDFDLMRLDSVDLNSNQVSPNSLKYNKETDVLSPSQSEDSFNKETNIFSPFDKTESLAKFYNDLARSSPSYAPVRNLLDFSLVDPQIPSYSQTEQKFPVEFLPEPLLPIPSGGHSIDLTLEKPTKTVRFNDLLNFSISSDKNPETDTASSTLDLPNSEKIVGFEPVSSIQSIFQPSTNVQNHYTGPASHVQSKNGSSPLPLKPDISGLNQSKPVLKPALLSQTSSTLLYSSPLQENHNVINSPVSSVIKMPKPIIDVNQASSAHTVAAPRPVRPPPPQTPAAFRLLRAKSRDSPTPKKNRFQPHAASQSPSRGIKKTPRKKSSIFTSSPSIKMMCKKRFAEALLDEEVALLTCRNFRNTIMTPSKCKRKESASNPLGRVLLEGDDTHFIPLSPIPVSKPIKSSALDGSAFSTVAKGT